MILGRCEVGAGAFDFIQLYGRDAAVSLGVAQEVHTQLFVLLGEENGGSDVFFAVKESVRSGGHMALVAGAFESAKRAVYCGDLPL